MQSLHVTPKAERQREQETVILLSAQGQPFSQSVAQELAATERVVILCGRYEGVDERVNEMLCDREISIGDYVLSGGELAAAVIVDAVVRLLPGALGNPDSSRFESFGAEDTKEDAVSADGLPRSTHGAGGLLDYPHYTRPAEFMGMSIPEALAGGKSRCDSAVAATDGVEEDDGEPAGPAGENRDQRRRPRDPCGVRMAGKLGSIKR